MNVAGIHHSNNVSTRRRNDKVTDTVVKATDVKQLCKCADVDESNNAVLTQYSQHLHTSSLDVYKTINHVLATIPAPDYWKSITTMCQIKMFLLELALHG